jgi:hypothetical protein
MLMMISMMPHVLNLNAVTCVPAVLHVLPSKPNQSLPLITNPLPHYQAFILRLHRFLTIRDVSHGITHKLVVYKTWYKGWGVRSRTPIYKGLLFLVPLPRRY